MVQLDVHGGVRDPGGVAVAIDLALPDGDARLERVDREAAGVEGAAAVRRADDDRDDGSPSATRPVRCTIAISQRPEALARLAAIASISATAIASYASYSSAATGRGSPGDVSRVVPRNVATAPCAGDCTARISASTSSGSADSRSSMPPPTGGSSAISSPSHSAVPALDQRAVAREARRRAFACPSDRRESRASRATGRRASPGVDLELARAEAQQLAQAREGEHAHAHQCRPGRWCSRALSATRATRRAGPADRCGCRSACAAAPPRSAGPSRTRRRGSGSARG
jgi:hypothetical protein